MTDKELLELAARAVGIRGEWNECCGKFEKLSDKGWHTGFFEPLTDDGEALRLAVKLNALIDINKGKSACVLLGPETEDEKHGNDQYAATRRAIVRAAAAIGEKL